MSFSHDIFKYNFILRINYIHNTIFNEYTPLYIACLKGNKKIVKYLLTLEDIQVNSFSVFLTFIFI